MSPEKRRILIYGGAAVVVVLAAGLGIVADLTLRPGGAVREVTVPAELAKPAAQPGSPPAASAPSAAPMGAAVPNAAPGAAAPPAKPAGPSFDVVRVEPNGDNVVAGRAAPDSKVDLLANGVVAGTATADEAGEFVITPPPLKPGSHELTLRATDAAGHAAVSRRSVVVSVPAKPGDQLLVVAQEPGKPAQILSAASGSPAKTGETSVNAPPAAAAGTEVAALSRPTATPPSGPGAARGALPHVDAVETDAGKLFVQGTGAPGARLGIYLNGTHVADAVVGKDGHWSLTVKRGLAAGDYQVRVDQIGPDGKVIARAAVPFDYHPAAGASAATAKAAAPPAAGASVAAGSGSAAGEAAAAPSRSGASASARSGTAPATSGEAVAGAAPTGGEGTAAPAKGGEAAPVSGQASAAAAPAAPSGTASTAEDAANPVIESLGTVKVVRGDSLWRISRTIYGHGIRYTVIYAANQDQIRDPDLIYPGQVFVIPPPRAKEGAGRPSPG